MNCLYCSIFSITVQADKTCIKIYFLQFPQFNFYVHTKDNGVALFKIIFTLKLCLGKTAKCTLWKYSTYI